MKKLVASLFTAVLLSTGLVMAEGTPAAHAAGYAPSVNTSTQVKGPKKVHVGKKVKVRAQVTNHAKGTVVIKVRYGHKLVKRVVRAVNGTKAPKIRFKARKTGKYRIKAIFHPAAGTPFKASVSKVKVVIVK